MDLRELMAGIGVVIDDALGEETAASEGALGQEDAIVEIVRLFEEEWHVPFYRATAMPAKDLWTNLLESAGFVLLDWKFWPSGATVLKNKVIEKHRKFVAEAERLSVPVFIFTNENAAEVKFELEKEGIDGGGERSLVLIQEKHELLSAGKLRLDQLEEWVGQNPAAYTMKRWDRLVCDARRSLFSAMHRAHPAWPSVFWQAYKADGVDPSAGLTELLSGNLWGRMERSGFAKEILGGWKGPEDEPGEGELRDALQEVIGAMTFRTVDEEDDIRSGDLFELSEHKFLLNIRADCDCVPRGGLTKDAVEVYCLKGRTMSDEELNEIYVKGHFREQIDQEIMFAVVDGKSIRFKFKKLRIEKFGDGNKKRIGRILHPYLRKVQQRYAAYLQRQGLPIVPGSALGEVPEGRCAMSQDSMGRG